MTCETFCAKWRDEKLHTDLRMIVLRAWRVRREDLDFKSRLESICDRQSGILDYIAAFEGRCSFA